MTISSENRKAGPFAGNDLTTVFPFTFKLFDKTQLQVIFTSAASVDSTLVLDIDYSVALNVDQDAAPGGSITYPIIGTPLATGTKLTGLSIVPNTQLTDITNGGGFFPQIIEDALDVVTILAQQLVEKLNRAIRQPASDSAAIGELPPSTGRALMYLAFDSSGNPIAAAPVTGSLVSVPMQPVVAAVSLASARALLGADAAYIAKSLIDAKGDLIVGTANDTPARKAVGTEGQILAVQGAQADGLLWTDYTRPNLLINGNWLIDQINEGALYTVTGGGADVQTVDGWSGSAPVAPGVFKVRRLADPDNAALKCLEITCTTIDAAIAAADAYYLHTAIEGQDAAALMAGTAFAQQITISFNFKSNVNGVYGVSIGNSALNRSYVGIFTVADAAEHTYFVTLTLDTGGTWLYDTGVGLRLRICLAGGSNFQKAAGAWGADNMLTTAAQCNFMSNVANVAYMKRIQLIPGSVVLPIPPADIQKDLARCQRYYEKSFAIGTAVAQNVGASLSEFHWGAQTAGATGQISPLASFKTLKRATPTLTFYNPAAANAQVRDVSAGADCSATTTGLLNASGFAVSCTGNAGTSIAGQLRANWSANARLT